MTNIRLRKKRIITISHISRAKLGYPYYTKQSNNASSRFFRVLLRIDFNKPALKPVNISPSKGAKLIIHRIQYPEPPNQQTCNQVMILNARYLHFFLIILNSEWPLYSNMNWCLACRHKPF